MKNLFFIVMLLSFLSLSAFGQTSKIVGIRLDPGYLYDHYSSTLPVSSWAKSVVQDIKLAGYNHIFVFAYSPVYGAFYNYSSALYFQREGTLGRGDFLKYLTQEAHLNGIKIIAGIPVNNFKSVWLKRPEWRSKKKNGADYRPDAETYPLSAWHSGFRAWLNTLASDLVARYGVDGIEALEPFVDWNMQNISDYNSAAVTSFNQMYPGVATGGSAWYSHRALGMTQLIGSMGAASKQKGASFWVVQTWTAKSTGLLQPSSYLARYVGFDFDGVLNLAIGQRPDYIVGEFIWQQWAAEFMDQSLFKPDWTLSAATSFVSKVAGRSIPVIHVEISPFADGNGVEVTPTDDQHRQLVRLLQDSNYDFDIYDHNLLKLRNLLSVN